MTDMAEFIRKEAKRLDGYVYCSYPYSCGLNEAIASFEGFTVPKHMDVTRGEKETMIKLKPLKRTGRRKLLIIRLWVA